MSKHLLPDDIILHRQSRTLELVYQQQHYHLPAEYLRISSPSAEVRGHSPEQATLPINKQHVGIDHLSPVGHYALKLSFDDGHDSGLYTWEYLHTLAVEYPARWQHYLDQLDATGHPRK